MQNGQSAKGTARAPPVLASRGSQQRKRTALTDKCDDTGVVHVPYSNDQLPEVDIQLRAPQGQQRKRFPQNGI